MAREKQAQWEPTQEDKLDLILKEVQTLRQELKAFKMNFMQINTLKSSGAARV